MKDFYNDINNLLSSKLAPQRTKKLLTIIKYDSILEDEFKILLHSREYLIAKSALNEIENDADQLIAKELARNHYLNK